MIAATTPLVVWIPVIIAVIAPLGAYLVAARTMSGKVSTSNADELWQESRSIREDCRQQLAASADRIRDLEARTAALEGKNNEIMYENIELRARCASLEALVAELRATILTLEGTIDRMKAEQDEANGG